MAARKKDDLLNEIAEQLGFSCLSDLRFIRDYSKLFTVLQSIPIQRYSLSAWNDAIKYIGFQERQDDFIFETPEEAYDHILNISRIAMEQNS